MRLAIFMHEQPDRVRDIMAGLEKSHEEDPSSQPTYTWTDRHPNKKVEYILFTDDIFVIFRGTGE